MDITALLDQAHEQASTRIDGLPEGVFDRPTLCAQWSVRDLLNHMVSVQTLLAAAAETGQLTPGQAGQINDTDWVATGIAEAWKTSAQRLTDAYRRPGTTLDDTVVLPGLGTITRRIALSIAAFDLVTHCADLAHATGQPMPPDPLPAHAIAIGTQLLAGGRDPANFDPQRPVADDAPPATRLLAFAGRHV